MYKIAFIFDKNNKGLTGRWFCNNAYRFFRKGLFENSRINVSSISFEQKIDCLELKDFDVLLFYDIRDGKLLNADKVKSLKISRGPDCHHIDADWIKLCRNLGISHIINHQPEVYARKYLPNDIGYSQIIFGINKELHVAKPYLPRRKDKILLTGVISKRAKYYILRTACQDLKYVEYVNRKQGFVVDRYPELLCQYRTAIAACSLYSVYKYFEIPACGCLSFMEVNAENGCGGLGFTDGQNAIFINRDNYTTKMEEFVNNPDDPKWENIANKGRQFILATYENKIQVNKLVDIIEGLL